MLGAGFPPESLETALNLGAQAFALGAGSTDSGPYCLATGDAKSSASAIERDLRLLLVTARRAGIPLVISSCGTGGTDAGVDAAAEMVRRIASREGLRLRLACLYSELSQDTVLGYLRKGPIQALAPLGDLAEDQVRSCAHVVGLM